MMAYPMLLGLLLLLPLIVIGRLGEETTGVVGSLVIVICGLVFYVFQGIWMVRRVRDFNGPVLVSVLFMVTMVFLPVVNLLLWLIPGTQGPNRFGAPPPANGLGLILIGLLMPLVAVAGILAAVAIPAYQDYTVKAKVSEGAQLSAPHRVAVGVACSEDLLARGSTHEMLGLDEPETYAGSYVQSVATEVVESDTARVVVTYREIGHAVMEGDTVVYEGTCRGGQVAWMVGGTVAETFRPRS